MTVLDTPPPADDTEVVEPWRHADDNLDGAETGVDPTAAGGVATAGDDEPLPPLPVRPLLAAFLATASAALTVGGIFDSWPARLLGVLAAAAGVAATGFTLRTRRQTLAQIAFGPMLVLAASLTLISAPGGPSAMPQLMRKAIDAGRLLHPPVPFDPGWRPIVVLVLAAVGFAAAWIGAAGDRPLLAVVVPLPLVGLAAITQPPHAQLLAALCIFVPLLGAVGVLFAAAGSGEQLDAAFEVRRALKAAIAGVPAVALLVALNSASFLFPKPTYDPNNKPQKPRSVPLSSAQDRVLFTVKAPAGFTGPWRTGVLDIYDEGGFKLPGGAPARAKQVPQDGVIDPATAAKASVTVDFVLGDMGDSPVLPTVPTAARVKLPAGAPDIRFDPRTGSLRMASGRAPSGLAYSVALPAYPTAPELEKAPPGHDGVPADDLTVPAPPAAVQRVLRDAPPFGWDRLDYVRHQLLDHVTAAGPGAPAAVDAARVQDMLDGSKKGTPFEIVAAQALLARWAGVPSRIGFGFNGVNEENGQLTIRPRNAAQWLEVYFPGSGWVPLLDVPTKADTSLDNPKDQQDKVEASNDVAVDVFLPVGVPHPVPAFEVVRARVLQALPFLLVLLALRLAAPAAARAVRRRRRERWGHAHGPRGRIGVAYAEFRDTATDLNVGDPFATAIEYLALVEVDHEHRELAWLVSRAMYGDLATRVTDADADAAEEMSRSLQRRLRGAQPVQVQIVGWLSQASLLKPFSAELPNVVLPQPVAVVERRVAAARADVAARRRRRRLRRVQEGRPGRRPAWLRLVSIRGAR